MMESESTELAKGVRYDLVVGPEGSRTQYSLRGAVFRGRLRLKGVVYEHFETDVMQVLIEPEDRRQATVVRKRYQL